MMPALGRDPRHQRAYAKLRRHRLATTPQPWVCWRCGRIITSPDQADLGHLIDTITEPGNLVVALEHRRCNRQAGQALAQERKAQARTQPPRWTTTEL